MRQNLDPICNKFAQIKKLPQKKKGKKLLYKD